jgi:alcohol dehydrogenase (cytochrome c)
MKARTSRHATPIVLQIAAVAAIAASATLATTAQQPAAGVDWTTYSGSFSSQRFSPLTQLSPANVSRLQPVWVYQPPGVGTLETTPLVANGVMYVTWGPTAVAALDVNSGKAIWEWVRPIEASVLNLGFPRVNRGVALLDDTVYVGTLDGYLVALNAKSGAERWSVHVGENPLGHSVTAAPLAVDGKIIVGVSGGEAGIRGFLDAYDANTGKQLWRFWTVPSPGEPGSDTWPGDSWVHGGGATWLTGSFDPELKLLYWGTGNPGPDWNGDSRIGDNLYTSSLVAIDVDTGKARWHFQFTPHDVHDWDANQIPVLVDAELAGARRKLVVMANRNAFFYALDRTTGEYLLGAPYAKQTWAKGLDAKGRPILIPGMDPSEKARSSIQACRARPTGPARRTVRRPDCCTCRYARWDRSISRPRSSIAPAPTTPAAAKSGWTKSPGERCGRSTSPAARRYGTSRCRRRPGPACCRRPADWYSAARTKAISSRSTQRAASRSGSSRPAD